MNVLTDLLRSELDVRREQAEGAVTVLRAGERASREALEEIEARLGWRFPVDYVECITKRGILHLDRFGQTSGTPWGPLVYDRMLSPAEVGEILDAFATWVEDCCAEFEDDPEGAAAEQGVRDMLVPFQFVGDGTAWDVYCFVRGDTRGTEVRVIPAYHDDEEMTEWAGQAEVDRVYGFTAHLRDWLEGR
jgi:hypothetical protein